MKDPQVKNGGFFPIGPYLPQHFLYFLPLPHGQGALRPTFSSVIFVFCGFNNISKSVISSSLSGSSAIEYAHPFSLNTDSTSFALSFVFTFTTAGFLRCPIFYFFYHHMFFPSSHPLPFIRRMGHINIRYHAEFCHLPA
jgi:hypothetical protein